MKPVAENRRATYEYEIKDRFEAGICLLGTEVKSLRSGKAQITDAYVQIRDGEVFLTKAHIPMYKSAGSSNHDPNRDRKLLLHPSEVEKLRKALMEKGLSVIATSLYFKDSWAKVEIAIGRGKKLHDKRESLKAQADRRELRQE